MNLKILLLTIVIGYLAAPVSAQHSEEKMTPAELAEHVSKILVEETEFHFEPALQELEQKRVLLVEFDAEKGASYYARMQIKAEDVEGKDYGHKFAISHPAGAVEVQLNGETIYSSFTDKDGPFDYKGYSVFEFQNKNAVELQNGKYPLVLKFTAKKAGVNRLYFTFVRSDNGLPDKAFGFRPPSQEKEFSEYKYWWIGPVREGQDEDLMNPDLSPQELVRQEFQKPNGDLVWWDLPKLRLIEKLPGNLGYQNWHYSTGTFLDAMKRAGEVFPHLDYSDYINGHLDFFLEHREKIGRMKEEYGIIEPHAFGHYFRFSLLDDMGMQTVPYINRLLEQENQIDNNSEEYELAMAVSNHILDEAARLADGTYARYNPDSMVVWADDLYMGSVVMLKMTELTGHEKYMNEVINQVKLFDKHLRDESSNLYWHGWFSRNQHHSSSKWARANGWTMMAKTELLLAMPEDHPERETILHIFKRHAEGLLEVQSSDGRWNQVLDNTETYLETSATAMFIRAFALGVVNGWLEMSKYKQAIGNGWIALTHQVNEDGDIEGIVRGTPIMFSDEDYANWAPRKNDPRGLGSLIYAAIAMDKYNNYK